MGEELEPLRPLECRDHRTYCFLCEYYDADDFYYTMIQKRMADIINAMIGQQDICMIAKEIKRMYDEQILPNDEQGRQWTHKAIETHIQYYDKTSHVCLETTKRALRLMMLRGMDRMVSRETGEVDPSAQKKFLEASREMRAILMLEKKT